MRSEEAKLVGELILERRDEIGAVLEIGSSDQYHREVAQPHISQHIHHPLAAAGVRVVTTDIKTGNGIDIAGDLFDPKVREKLAAVKPDLVLCCNILEHVSDRQAFAAAVSALVAPGKRLLITVPRSYPYHLDPIDTMFRPTPEQIAALFPGFAIEFSSVFDAGSFRADMKRHGGSIIVNFARTVLRSIWPWQGLEPAKSRWHRWLWLFRPFKMSLALLRRAS